MFSVVLNCFTKYSVSIINNDCLDIFFFLAYKMNEIDLPEINNEYKIIKKPSKILELRE